jgi:hypothetical protein
LKACLQYTIAECLQGHKFVIKMGALLDERQEQPNGTQIVEAIVGAAFSAGCC